MRNLLAASVLAGSLLFAAAAAAQSSGLAIELRGAFAQPTGEWSQGDALGNGFGYGANLQLRLLPVLAAYGGWERFNFPVGEDGLDPGTDTSVNDTGYRAGLIAMLPLGRGPAIAPFLLGGGTYDRLTSKVRDDAGSVSFSSENEIGFEVGGGILIPLGPVVSFTPAARYRSYRATQEAFGGAAETETTVTYYVVDVGLRYVLGQ